MQFGIANYVSRFIKTEADYLVAGRNLPVLIASFTIFATWFGVETCVGVAGKVAAYSVSEGNAEPFGYALALAIVGLLFAKKVWNRKIITIGDVFRQSYGRKSEVLIAALLIPASVIWAAAQIRTFGAIIGTTFDISVSAGILFAAFVVITYTVRGGLMADALTDFVQGFVLILGLVALLVVILLDIPSLSTAWNQIPAEKISLFPQDTSLLEHIDAWVIPIAGTIIAQELIAKIAASRSGDIARKACLWASFGYLSVGLVPVFIGLMVAQLNVPLVMTDLDKFLIDVSKAYLPSFGFVIFAGALISAVLSTVDTALLVASSLACHNILLPHFKIEDESQKVLFTRIGVFTIGLLATIMAFFSDSVYELVVEASAFGGGGILVTFVIAIFAKQFHPKAGLASLLFGAMSYSIGYYGFAAPGSYVISAVLAAVCYFATTQIFPNQFKNLS